MKSNYKRLGDYIRQVDVRNRDLAVNSLLGLSVNKQFIPSIANTIGTDMTSYKVVSKNQFVYIPDTSRRGDKIAIALLDKWDKAIVSAIYTVFEIVDETELLPEYLMMWFRRPEFDRYARFKSHGSAREVFEWKEMCEVMLPIPPIEEQRKIVAEYQAIEKRIENNRRLIATLEATAQTIYRKMFVDDIELNNLPEGWRMGKMKDIASFAYGKMPKTKATGNIPVFSGYGIVGYCSDEMYSKRHIVVIARGDSGSGKIVLSPQRFYLTNLAIAVLLDNDAYHNYLFQYLISQDTSSLRTGSAQAQVTINNLAEFSILIPPVSICTKYHDIVDTINAKIECISTEISILEELKKILLTELYKY